jgi:hypothetical protein
MFVLKTHTRFSNFSNEQNKNTVELPFKVSLGIDGFLNTMRNTLNGGNLVLRLLSWDE